MCPSYVVYLISINFRRFAIFDKVCKNLYLRKMLFWKILSFLGNFRDFCGISVANPRKHVPEKYGHLYRRENKYPRKLIPIRYISQLMRCIRCSSYYHENSTTRCWRVLSQGYHPRQPAIRILSRSSVREICQTHHEIWQECFWFPDG